MRILLLHGWKVDLSSARIAYKPIICELEKRGHTVYAPDLPGFGSCSPPDKPYSVSDYASWVYRYLKRRKKPIDCIIGHSFGGRIAIVLSAKHSEIAKKLILSGVPAVSTKSFFTLFCFKILAKTGKIILYIPIFSRSKKFLRKLLYKLAGSWDYYHAKSTMQKTFLCVIKEDLKHYMKHIHIKTLLIWGENDRITPIGVAYKMQKYLKKSKVDIVPDAGHNVLLEKPDIFTNSMMVH